MFHGAGVSSGMFSLDTIDTNLVEYLVQHRYDVTFAAVSCSNQLETFRFWEEDDYEVEIFSILSSARAWTSVIFAGNVIAVVILLRTGAAAENIVVAETSYQMLEVLSFGAPEKA